MNWKKNQLRLQKIKKIRSKTPGQGLEHSSDIIKVFFNLNGAIF